MSEAIKQALDYRPGDLGLYSGMSMSAYQAIDGFSKSRADVLCRSPLDLKRMMDGQLERGETDAMELGTVYHSLVWEGIQDFYCLPETYMADGAKKGDPRIEKKWNANATACKEWLADHADRPCYSLAEVADIQAGADYVRNHPLARSIIEKIGMVEVSMFARASVYGFAIKGRADKVWFEGGKIYFADLKTIRDASTRSASREILNRRYHVQAAMYRYIAQKLGFEFGGFVLIFFEAGRAPKCNVRWLAKPAIDEGERQLQADFDLFIQCRVGRTWPEWADQEEGIGYIDLPEFVYGDVELTGMTIAKEDAA